MAFDIRQRSVDGITVLSMSGRMTAGDPIDSVRSHFERLLKSGINRVVLDLRDTTYIDSSALGCLVMAHTRSAEADGKMTIFGLSSRQLELMVLTKLTTVFEIYQEEMDAIDACIPGRQPRRFDLLEFVERQRREKKAEA